MLIDVRLSAALSLVGCVDQLCCDAMSHSTSSYTGFDPNMQHVDNQDRDIDAWKCDDAVARAAQLLEGLQQQRHADPMLLRYKTAPQAPGDPQQGCRLRCKSASSSPVTRQAVVSFIVYSGWRSVQRNASISLEGTQRCMPIISKHLNLHPVLHTCA